MSTSVTSVTKHFPSPQNGFTTTTSGSVASGAATVGLNSVAGYTNGQTVVFVIDPTDASKKQTFTGTMDTSGSQVTGVVWTAGTNQTHALGATVVDYATATHIAMMSKGILAAGITQAGGMGAITPTSVASTGAVSGTTGTFTGNVSENSQTLQTIRSEREFDFVASGCVWSGDSYGSTRAASMTSGVVYIGGKRVAVSAVSARTFTASKDTYIDVDNAGTITYTEVANNAASPALSANNIRLGIIITAAGSIANAGSVNQGEETKVLPIASSTPYAVTDSLGNLICPRDPQRKILGYRQITSGASQAALALVTGLTMPIIVPTGRKVKISVVVGPSLSLDTNASNARISIWDGTVSSGTQLQENGFSTAAANQGVSLSVMSIATLSAGLHTINIGGRVAGAGTQTVNAAATTPTFVMAELV